jgi:hypothetical protein
MSYVHFLPDESNKSQELQVPHESRDNTPQPQLCSRDPTIRLEARDCIPAQNQSNRIIPFLSCSEHSQK